MTDPGEPDDRVGIAAVPPPSGLVRKGWTAVRGVLTNPRIRGEIGWVVVNKGVEFGLLFVLLKILTNGLGKAGYGEYNLAETALVLVTGLGLVPIVETYLRDYHGAGDRDERRSAGLLLIRWYAVATLGVALIAAGLTAQLAQWLGIGRWTALAAGLVFLFERWRFLGQNVLNIQRKRREWTLYNLSYYLTQVSLISAVVFIGPATPSAALFAYAGAAGLFAILVAGPMIRSILRLPVGRPSRLMGMVLSFGLPYAALLLFEWLQGFSDRYMVATLMGAEKVGVYVAAYQVCGIPFTLLLRVGYNLLTPIAYERGRDADDPAHLWSADRLLIGGMIAQITVGLCMLVIYALFGQYILILLTNDQFLLPTSTLLLLAAARFVQAISQSLQPIFAVHHRMGSLLWFRLFGAVLTLGICWPLVSTHGTFGAAAGAFAAFSIYLVALVFGPNGCWWLVSRQRRLARTTASS